MGEMKINVDHSQLIKKLPPEFKDFLAYINTLDYNTPPDYKVALGVHSRLRRAEPWGVWGLLTTLGTAGPQQASKGRALAGCGSAQT